MATILIHGVPHEMETLRYLCSLTTQREARPCYFTELSTLRNQCNDWDIVWIVSRSDLHMYILLLQLKIRGREKRFIYLAP